MRRLRFHGLPRGIRHAPSPNKVNIVLRLVQPEVPFPAILGSGTRLQAVIRYTRPIVNGEEFFLNYLDFMDYITGSWASDPAEDGDAATAVSEPFDSKETHDEQQ